MTASNMEPNALLWRNLNGIKFVEFPYEVDFSNVGAIRDALIPLGDTDSPLIISFERCQYCDSTGISVLVTLHKKLGNRLVLAVPPGSQIRQILQIARLLERFPIADSTEAAVARLRGASARAIPQERDATP
jgi:anti-anti-sigma factor